MTKMKEIQEEAKIVLGILSNSFFLNSFFYFQNLLSTSLFFYLVFLIFKLTLYSGRQYIFLFSQSISRLWATSYGISQITFVFPKLQMFIFTLSTCPLKNMLHLTS